MPDPLTGSDGTPVRVRIVHVVRDPPKWQRDVSETLAAFAERATEHGAFLAWADAAGLPT